MGLGGTECLDGADGATLVGRARVIQPEKRPSTLTAIPGGNSLTGELYAGKPPVQFGGRGGVFLHPYPYVVRWDFGCGWDEITGHGIPTPSHAAPTRAEPPQVTLLF